MKKRRYREYHSSLDNKSIISFEYLNENIKLFIKLFKKIEFNFKQNKNNLVQKKNKLFNNTFQDQVQQFVSIIKVNKCEPHLSKWKIHYDTKIIKLNIQTQTTKWLIHFQMENSIEQISKMSSVNSNLIYKVALKMKKSKLILLKNTSNTKISTFLYLIQNKLIRRLLCI